MKQLFHNLNSRRKYDINKHQRWGLIVNNFVGFNAVVSYPRETFCLFNVVRKCFSETYLFLLINYNRLS